MYIFKEEYVNEMNRLEEAFKTTSKYKKILIRIFSVLLAFFFISAPLAILINLLLFEDYYYLLSIGISFLVMILLILSNQFYLSMMKRLVNNNLNTKSITIYNLIESFVFAIICYIILVIISKGVI